MHRIDSSTATLESKFTSGNPSTATPATVITADWLNAVQEEIANVITGAGISLNKPTNTQLLEAIRALATPTGAVEAYAGATAPAGWLLCNGQAVSRTTYAALFALVGTTYGAGNGSTTFNVPDLRGEFIRGVDGGRNVDPSRTLGSWQKGSMVPLDSSGINQSYIMQANSANITSPGDVALSRSRLGLDYDGTTYPNTYITWLNSTNDQLPETGGFYSAQSRPRNVALNFIIKT